MSRVTPPVARFAHALRRSISSSAHANHPSALLDSSARASRYLPRSVKDLRAECSKRNLKVNGRKSELVDRLAAHDIMGSHNFHTMGSHRPIPTPITPSFRTVHLMQGFRTSPPKAAAHDNSTIDFFFFPEIPAEATVNPFKIRVPLLPDNYNPDRSANSPNALETLDEAVPRPEITIVASHPEDVVPATISEVVGNDGEPVDLAQLTTSAFASTVEAIKEPGIIKELWSGFVDDILGPKGPKTAV